MVTLMDAPSSPELIENCLVRLDDVRKLLGAAHEGQFPEAKGIADNERVRCRDLPALTP